MPVATRKLLVPLGGGASTPPVGPLVLQDAFGGVDGTDLTVHTMDLGPGWLSDGSFDIQSNRAHSVSSGSTKVAYANASISDARISAIVNRGGTNFGVGVVLRFLDSSNYWLLDLGSSEFALYEVNAGVFTKRASRSVSNNSSADHTIIATCSASLIIATMDGGNQVVFSSVFLQTETRFGLKSFNSAHVFDDFDVRRL